MLHCHWCVDRERSFARATSMQWIQIYQATCILTLPKYRYSLCLHNSNKMVSTLPCFRLAMNWAPGHFFQNQYHNFFLFQNLTHCLSDPSEWNVRFGKWWILWKSPNILKIMCAIYLFNKFVRHSCVCVCWREVERYNPFYIAVLTLLRSYLLLLV